MAYITFLEYVERTKWLFLITVLGFLLANMTFIVQPSIWSLGAMLAFAVVFYGFELVYVYILASDLLKTLIRSKPTLDALVEVYKQGLAQQC